MKIHPTAIVSKKAKINKGVEVGPYVIIEDDVRLAQGVKIYPHAHILNRTVIGEGCQIHTGAVLGHLPQIRKKVSLDGQLIVGCRNIFREYTTVHRSQQKEGATVIGNDNYFMAFAHIAHDCNIGNHITICNGTLIAGHVLIEDYSFISGNSTVHQFCQIGKFSMIGGLSRVAKDVPPFMLVKGDSLVWSVNSVGLRRENFPQAVRRQIKRAFKLLYKSDLNVSQALQKLEQGPRCCEIEHLINFISNSKRGICGHKQRSLWQRIRLSSSIIKRGQIPAYQLFQN